MEALINIHQSVRIATVSSHGSADVQPMDLCEPERPVVAIQYSDEARQRLAYLYALAAAGDVSERTFRLTAQVNSLHMPFCCLISGIQVLDHT